jgi:hypothetical protein
MADQINPFAEDASNPYAIHNTNNQGHANAMQGAGYVNQIPFVGIFTIVQGSLELLMGIGASFVTVVMALDVQRPRIRDDVQGVSPTFLVGIFAFFASAISIIAILRIVAGILTLYQRARVFTLVIAVIGLSTSLTCYCSLTSIAVAIYSLVVLVQPSVIQRYRDKQMSS